MEIYPVFKIDKDEEADFIILVKHFNVHFLNYLDPYGDAWLYNNHLKKLIDLMNNLQWQKGGKLQKFLTTNFAANIDLYFLGD